MGGVSHSPIHGTDGHTLVAGAVPACAVHPLVNLGGAVGPPEVVHCPGSCIFLHGRELKSAAMLRRSTGRQSWDAWPRQASPVSQAS